MQVRLERLRQWPVLWRVCCVGMVMMLSLGTSVLPAQAQTPIMAVDFSPRTPPLAPGVICAGQEYEIHARPAINTTVVGAVPLYGGMVVALPKPLLGTISPTASIVTAGGPAVFTYKYDGEGNERLHFSAVTDIVSLSSLGGSGTIVSPLVSRLFDFKVKFCAYNVTLIYTLQILSAGTSKTVSATLLDIKLEQKPDGTFDGSGVFIFGDITNLPGCSGGFSGFNSETHITGKVLDDPLRGSPLELTFDFGKGTNTYTVTCAGVTASGGVGIDVAGIVGVKTIQFPTSGGSKQFDTPPIPASKGYFTVVVEPAAAGD